MTLDTFIRKKDIQQYFRMVGQNLPVSDNFYSGHTFILFNGRLSASCMVNPELVWDNWSYAFIRHSYYTTQTFSAYSVFNYLVSIHIIAKLEPAIHVNGLMFSCSGVPNPTYPKWGSSMTLALHLYISARLKLCVSFGEFL
jgi:hypothetical protein